MANDPINTLTPRQLELLAMYASGSTLEEIASAKFLSYSSVKQNLASAKERVGAKSLTHLCVLSVDAGVIVKSDGGYKPIQDERVVAE
jgi:DNA-binding CsgD family transcriptional regulator